MNDQASVTMTIVEMSTIFSVKNALTKDQCARFNSAILHYKNTYVPSKDERSFLDGANQGCWRGLPHLSDSFDQELKNVMNEVINKYTFLYFSNLPMGENWKNTRYKSQYWFNVNEPGAQNALHSHAPYLLSGVLYFRASGTGCITFYPLNFLYNVTNKNDPFHKSWVYLPEDGDLLLFPSFLAHSVEPNPASHQRINVAFNMMEATPA